ncbi:MAG: MFS transporter [Nitrososphaeria archaeon]
MQKLDVPKNYEARATLASFLGYMLDGFDTYILSLTLTAIALAFSLTSAEEGLLGFIQAAGMVTGGYVFGILADRFGRVRTFTYSILIYSVFTALTAVAPSYAFIALFRFLSGVGTGAEYGIGMTLMSEAFRAKWRGMGSTIVSLGWTLGVMLATVLGLVLMPAFGWRSMYLIGILPALVAAYYRFRLPESPVWKERTTESERKKFQIKELFRREYLKFTIVFLVVAIVAELGYWGVMIWLPSSLLTEYHIHFVKTIYILLVTDVMTMLGMIIFGFLADVVGRKVAIFLGFIGITFAVIYFAISRTVAQVMIASYLMGFFINSYFTTFGALFSEPYPTHARATAVNFIFNTGRGFGGIAPLIIGVLAPLFKISGVIGFFSVLFIIAAVSILTIPETKGVELK